LEHAQPAFKLLALLVKQKNNVNGWLSEKFQNHWGLWEQLLESQEASGRGLMEGFLQLLVSYYFIEHAETLFWIFFIKRQARNVKTISDHSKSIDF
jgi:hypothetical protein